MRRKEITLRGRIDELTAIHGGLRITARAIGIDPGYLTRLATGNMTNPSAVTLRRLGLVRHVTYTFRTAKR